MVNEISNFIRGNVRPRVSYRLSSTLENGKRQIILKSPFLKKEDLVELALELNKLSKKHDKDYIFLTE